MIEAYFNSAYTYLDQWIYMDRELRNSLGFREGDVPNEDSARSALVRAATYYGVSRNFKTERNSPRLGEAWTALKQIGKPNSPEEAVKAVKELMGALQKHYQKELCSAASKFLWLRFGSPIIIYDTIAWNWMCNAGGCLKNDGYDQFCKGWNKEFENRRAEIAKACAGLPSIRKFLRPNDVSDSELLEVISSEWFTERVFDHFMLNAEEWSRRREREGDPTTSVQ